VLPERMNDLAGKSEKAINELFEQGLADPRDLPYHHVKVKEGGNILKGRGWVLPSQSDEVPRFVIGWSGLIYPVEEVGEVADLKADLIVLREKGHFGEEPAINYQDEILDDLVAKFVGSARMMHPWAAPYFLPRLGYPIQLSDEDEDPFAVVEEPPFKAWRFKNEQAQLLIDYARHLRADGVAAYLNQNDRVAVERLRGFDKVWAEVLRRLPAEVEGQEELDPDPFGIFGGEIPEINSSWREVLGDAQRRLEGKAPVGESKIAKAIASWEHLEEWDETVRPQEFRDVVEMGPLAVKPLLDCLESDGRWTRIVAEVGYRDRSVVRVRDLAILALEEVLQFTFIEYTDSQYEWPPEVEWYEGAAAKIRFLCERYEYQCGGELWFRILEDQEGDLAHQAMAAVAIVQPENAESYYGITDQHFVVDEVWDRYDIPQASWEGETLRERHEPSVLELMEKAWQRECTRVEEKLAEGEPESFHPFFVGGSFQVLRRRAHLFMRCLEEWQPGNIEILKSHYNRLEKAVLRGDEGHSIHRYLLSELCEEVLIRRLWVEDKTAIVDYSDLFRSSFDRGHVPMKVMKELPRTPGMDLLVNEAFLGEKAPLSFRRKSWSRSDPRAAILRNCFSLFSLPSFREAVVEGLRNRNQQGVMTIGKVGTMMAFLTDEAEDEEVRLYEGAAMRGEREIGWKAEVRMCDLVALYLSPDYGDEVWITPDFHLDDPVAVRDGMIGDWIKLFEAKR